MLERRSRCWACMQHVYTSTWLLTKIQIGLNICTDNSNKRKQKKQATERSACEWTRISQLFIIYNYLWKPQVTAPRTPERYTSHFVLCITRSCINDSIPVHHFFCVPKAWPVNNASANRICTAPIIYICSQKGNSLQISQNLNMFVHIHFIINKLCNERKNKQTSA